MFYLGQTTVVGILSIAFRTQTYEINKTSIHIASFKHMWGADYLKENFNKVNTMHEIIHTG